jgi:hypothetical protein
MSSKFSTPDEVRARIDAHVALRGYLLPQQGLMAVAMPAMQDGYRVMYHALTVQENHFSAYEREFVWMGILSAAGEHIGTHHVRLFKEFGGTPQQAEVVIDLVGLAMGAERSYQFMHQHWQKHFEPLDAVASYRRAAQRIVAGSDVPLELARYLLLAVHTTFGHAWGVEQELLALYDEGGDEGKMAESLSLPFWAAGVNRMIDACQIWLKLMRSGRVQPSEPFRVWAETSGQGAMAI